ncbi:phosphotransferase [Leucobacter allii]|uniref:phosphotransferase n=1 Tax=Leucobacter allii TaxID=2932247 RepID=UPI001FD4FF94|nr:phosphotransferase [Leucobacter allii]UOR00671.1 phosphotransferase [Leucobacter allii]
MDSEFLPGGSGGVWRVTDARGRARVLRPTGPWTPAVHALLAHLAARGLDGVPAVLGIDEEGREILEYLPGETLDPEVDAASDAALVAAAGWLRRFHEAARDFRPGRALWRQGEQELGADEVICHNDPGLYNWVLRDGEFAGMIDWDRAGPGRPIDDLAFLCWSGIPCCASCRLPTPRGGSRSPRAPTGTSNRSSCSRPSTRGWRSSTRAGTRASNAATPARSRSATPG